MSTELLKGRGNPPRQLSDWERTYNNAIDIVAEAVAHAKKVETRYVTAVRLKPSAYANFVEGVKILMARQGQQWDPMVELTWEGVLVLEGSKAQIDTIKFEYMENGINTKFAN
jgi:chaperone required for assembly of F1-ATPase